MLTISGMAQYPCINTSISYRVWLLNNHWQRELRLKLAEFGLTYTEFLIMSVLIIDIKTAPGFPKLKRGLNQKYVQDLLGLNKMVVSQSVTSLHHKLHGFLYR